MKKKYLPFFIVAVILIIAIVISGYFYFKPKQENRFPGIQFQLTDQEINDINSFFSSNPSLNEVQSYCSTNREYCFYYCRNINQDDEICKTIMNFSRGPGNRTRDGNYSGAFNRSRYNGGTP